MGRREPGKHAGKRSVGPVRTARNKQKAQPAQEEDQFKKLPRELLLKVLLQARMGARSLPQMVCREWRDALRPTEHVAVCVVNARSRRQGVMRAVDAVARSNRPDKANLADLMLGQHLPAWGQACAIVEAGKAGKAGKKLVTKEEVQAAKDNVQQPLIAARDAARQLDCSDCALIIHGKVKEVMDLMEGPPPVPSTPPSWWPDTGGPYVHIDAGRLRASLELIKWEEEVKREKFFDENPRFRWIREKELGSPKVTYFNREVHFRV